MKIKTLDNFLGCCDLDVGAKIIGFMGLFSSICNVSTGILGGYTAIEEEVKDYVHPGFLNNTVIILGIFGLLLASLLLYGVYKKRPSFLLPWLLIDGLFLGIFIIIVTGCVLVVIYNGSVTVGVTFFILFAAVFGIGLYLWFCIFSFYQKLKTSN